MIRPLPQSITLLDAHVHVYPNADVAGLLGAAARHFGETAGRLGTSAWHGVLFLTEIAGTNWFDAVAESPGGRRFGSWQVSVLPHDPLSLVARSADDTLRIVAGRQIVTAERIEVHALATRQQFPDGMKLPITLREVRDSGAVAVLPWGVGKWLGKRGKLVESTLATGDAGLLVSDIRGRPWFWQNSLLKRTRAAGRHVLRGSDPLPLPAEELRVGEFGCWMTGAMPVEATARTIIGKIRQSVAEDLHDYGKSESAGRFFLNQFLLRLRR